MANRPSFVACLTLVLASCVTVNHALLSSSRLAYPVPASEVRVYFANDTLPRYERIAMLTVEGAERDSDQEMLDKLRERAGSLGANAIILNELRNPTAGERAAGWLTGMPARQSGQAIAVWILPTR